METVRDFIFLGSKITVDGDCSYEIKRRLLLGRKAVKNLDSILKSRDITWPTKILWSKLWFFQWSCMDMSELDNKKGWALKKWCFWTVVLEKTLESPLDCKKIKPVHPKENQLWIFFGRTDAEAEAPIFWPPVVKSQFTGKDPHAGKNWGQEEKGMTEHEMVGWPHWQWTWVWATSGWWWRTEKLGVLQFMGLQSLTWLSDWTSNIYDNYQIFKKWAELWGHGLFLYTDCAYELVQFW